MKLRTSLQVSAVFPILLAIMVSMVFMLKSHRSGVSEERFFRMEQLLRSSSELNRATHMWLTRGSADARDVWRLKLNAVTIAMSDIQTTSPSAQLVLNRLQRDLKEMIDIFGTASEDKTQPPLTDKKVAEMLASCDSLVSGIFELSSAMSTEIGEERSTADMVFAVLIGIAGLMMTFVTLSISRDVVQRLRQLGEWARSVSERNLDTTKPAKGHDEVGELSRSLSEMTMKLSQSREAMVKEVAEHKRVADALRESNALVSGALEKLKRAQQQMVQQERYHTLEQVIKGVAHDFNNALMPIIGASEYLLRYPESLKEPAVLDEQLRAINEASMQARDQMKKLAQFFAQPKKGDTQWVDVSAVAEKAIEVTQPKWREEARAQQHEIVLKKRLGKVALIDGNEHELVEAVVNLIMNSIDAMPRGGAISVVTDQTPEAVTIDVADNGEGMSREVKERCLEPFYSTKGMEGTGMGLSVVSGVVKAHGGKMEIDSAPGKGTRIRLLLPLAAQEQEDTFRTKKIRKLDRKLSILVVDDDQRSRLIAAKILAKEGHTVDVAEGGKIAIEKFRNGRYDLVITDRAMPDISGDAVAKMVKEIRSNVPVMLMTGFGDVMIADAAMPEGVDAVVPKPVGIDELLRTVETVMGMRDA
ncbi:MAG: hypothetical protein C0404_11325 [Verrucomicrobia bacterium]|nr:hypothetical protein [Verrucomicrobiota bacterium]